MQAHAVPLLAIFEKKVRLEVPLFQRQYVWTKDQQWEPLWEDIKRKFEEYLEGRKGAPVHFLGAMVLDQKQTPVTHVEKRQVIDGQQRLTTLQIFLAALRDFAQAHDCMDVSRECESFTFNKGMMAEPAVDKFKVWPTQRDRPQYIDVIESRSVMELEKRHPIQRRKYARKPEPRPRMVEAYLYFYEQVTEFFMGTVLDQPIAAEVPLSTRLDECLQALKNSLKIVAIDLEQDDDAQVIFETLNARGEPLLPADLLRNYIFLRAARRGEEHESLYEEYWRRFDDPFWRVEVKQGRLLRPRSDLFLQHFLASRQGADIPIKHLFVEYKFWIDHEKPFDTVRDELKTLAKQGEDFRRIIEPSRGDVLYGLASFLDAFDVRTSYPLLLAALGEGVDDGELRKLALVLESYILRRAVCGLTTKNYNRVFLGITRSLRKVGFAGQALARQLLEQTGESSEWPSDAAFKEAWSKAHAYQVMNNAKIVHILKRLNGTFVGGKMESVSIDGPLSVEHIMPQNWVEHWQLESGHRGLTAAELWMAEPTDTWAMETRARNAAVQTIGNLTILTQPLNSSVSNAGWDNKRPEIMKHSLLPLNQHLAGIEKWDEDGIRKRGETLFGMALKLWPRESFK